MERRPDPRIVKSRSRRPSLQAGTLVDALEPVLAQGGPAEIRRVLKRAARAHGVSVLARETGLTREAIYKALGDQGNPTLDTLSRLLDAMELRLFVRAAPPEERAPRDDWGRKDGRQTSALPGCLSETHDHPQDRPGET